MKRKGLTLVLATSVLLAGVLPTNVLANESYYQATSQLELENIIFAAIQERETAFKIRYSGETSDIKGIVRLARDNAVVRDPYEESSISLISGFKISSSPDQADISFDGFQYFTTGEQEDFVAQEVDRIIGQVITAGMTDDAKVQAIHEYIMDHVEYDYSLAGYTAYSALTDGVTVCNGYVQLAYKLLNRVGLETKMVKGILSVNGNAKDHAWLLVNIAGNWYHLDPTLNDTQLVAGAYKYYALSDAEIFVDHNFDRDKYPAASQSYPKSPGDSPDDTPDDDPEGTPGNGPSGSTGGATNGTVRYFTESMSGTTVVANLDIAKTLALIENSEATLGIYELVVVSTGDGYEISLPATVLDKLVAKNPQAIIRVTTPIGGYDLPVQVLNQSLKGAGMQDSANQFIISITKVTGVEQTKVQQLVKQAGLNLVSAPVKFVLELEHKGSKRTLPGMKQFVRRSQRVNGTINQDQAVGLVYNSTQGEVLPVPMQFANVGGQKIANLMAQKDGIFLIATANNQQFTDLSGHWAKINVDRMAAKLIVQGKDAQHFDPQGRVTRAEFAAMLVRALGLTPEPVQGAGTSEKGFTDVADQWYAAPVRAAVQQGLVTGYSDGTFRPTGVITREEMAVMINRAMSLAGAEVTLANPQGGLDKFQDQGKIKGWAKEAVAKANYAKVIQGNQLGNFAPQAQATRAEAVTMLDRALRFIGFIN